MFYYNSFFRPFKKSIYKSLVKKEISWTTAFIIITKNLFISLFLLNSISSKSNLYKDYPKDLLLETVIALEIRIKIIIK